MPSFYHETVYETKYDMEDKSERISALEPVDGFILHEQLKIANKEISESFTPATGSVYRTFISNPPDIKDFTAKSFREPDGMGLVEGGLSKDEYDKLTQKQKQDYISDRALSVNNTPENAISAAVGLYKRLERRIGTEDAEAYIEDDRGKYVGEIVWKPGQAIISAFSKSGHADVILNQSVNPEDIEVRNLIEYKYKDE